MRLLRFEQEVEAEETGLYFRQLLPGVDMCRGTYNPIRKIVYEFARGMQNIVYVIGDKNRQECMIVDACWDSDGILEIVQKDGMKVIGCIVTHNHFDHVGGKPPPPFASFGVTVQGLKNILEKFPTIPVYIHKDDADVLQNETGIFPDRIKTTFDGFEFNIGTIRMQTIHTPGHTPGSQCILINDRRLLTGDTLFANSCGRMDLPGGCPYAMYDSLKSRLAGLDQSLVVYPGHSYGNFFLTTIDREVRLGVLNPETLEEWLRKVGHSEQKHC